jgi:N-methylhydantoinase A
MGTRVGADIGGTFTDVVVEADEQRWSVKVPTTHAAPEQAVLEGVARALALAGRTLAEVELFVHGTTLATNALIERKGARTALLTTRGFRDVLETGTEGRFDQYDLRVTRPTPLVPRSLRFEAAERLRHDGSVIEPLDETTVYQAVAALRAADVEAVAIAFLHAYADPSHEARAEAIVRTMLPGVAVSTSYAVSPEMREYERVSTTCANAYLQPVVSAYLLRLEVKLQADGLGGPMLMILSSGSLTTVETAARFPIRLLESGPAGGVIFACDIARRLGLDRVLSFDVGGTTAKFCLIDDGEARHARSFEVGRTYRFKKGSGLPVRVPVVDLVEIGAGGGSIARLDAIGRITVGPDSAGSEPGPACYGRGGTLPTVTDCDLAQGKLDPVTFAAGTMPLDRAAAARAIAAGFGSAAGLTVENAAYAVAETVTESMAAAARVHAAEIGTTLDNRTLIAFGGGAPLHAARFAEKLGIRDIVVPSGAGVGSAIGFLRAPLAYEVVRTMRLLLPDGDCAPAGRALREMEQQARAIVAEAGHDETPKVTRTAFIRYVGQGHEIEVPVDSEPDAQDFGDLLYAAFTAAYARHYRIVIADAPAEVTAWGVRVAMANMAGPAQTPETAPDHAPVAVTRRVYEGATAAWSDWDEYDRSALAPGATCLGPAIVAEAETTTVIPRGFSFLRDPHGMLRLTRKAEA